MAGRWSESMVGDVLVATFADPPMSYFTQEATEELGALITGWAAVDARAIIITGGVDGKFITHFDVAQILPDVLDPSALIERGPVRNRYIDRILAQLSELPIPVIAAINGDAMGFGFELAMACDLRVAADGDHRIGPCEPSLGIIAGAGGTQRLLRAVGLSRALDIGLRAKVLTPQEALTEGLLSEIGPDALELALRIGRHFASMPKYGIAMTKRALHLGAELPLPYALEMESDASFRTKLADGTREALERYLSLAPEQRRAFLDRWRDDGPHKG